MRYDAVIVGSGPAGGTAALRLARAGLRVAVVEKSAFPRRKVCGEFVGATTWPLLRHLGVAPDLGARAGPAVRRVGLFGGAHAASAPMPSPRAADAWGRAVGREHLDAMLLDAAVAAGATAWQPFTVVGLEDEGASWRVVLSARAGASRELRSRIVVAAHGSWEPGSLPAMARPGPRSGSDLLGFKAHFHDADLDRALMPLVLFPGGYGGLVRGGDGRVGFSCCIRRDALARCREAHRGMGAGDAVLAHAQASCEPLRAALSRARRDGRWLSAGPIRPGVRPLAQGRLFAAGNAAGEAHPLVAEGIGMAIQSAWLLAAQLAEAGDLGDAAIAAAGRRYAAQWRANFAPRIHASRAFAALTTTGATARVAIATLAAFPAMLTLGAAWSGKARMLHPLRVAP